VTSYLDSAGEEERHKKKQPRVLFLKNKGLKKEEEMFKLGFISDGLAPLFFFISHHDDENLKRSSLHRHRDDYREVTRDSLRSNF